MFKQVYRNMEQERQEAIREAMEAEKPPSERSDDRSLSERLEADYEARKAAEREAQRPQEPERGQSLSDKLEASYQARQSAEPEAQRPQEPERNAPRLSPALEQVRERLVALGYGKILEDARGEAVERHKEYERKGVYVEMPSNDEILRHLSAETEREQSDAIAFFEHEERISDAQRALAEQARPDETPEQFFDREGRQQDARRTLEQERGGGGMADELLKMQAEREQEQEPEREPEPERTLAEGLEADYQARKSAEPEMER